MIINNILNTLNKYFTHRSLDDQCTFSSNMINPTIYI